MWHYPLINIFAFITGSVFGSFLNVCIYRIPKEQSIVRPGSHCMNCQKPIRWHDNIPVLSYFFLKGRCRDCHALFSIRYTVIEFITGLSFLLLWVYLGLTWQSIVGAALFCSLLVVTMIDFDHQIIPDEISLGGIVVGLIVSAFVPALHHQVVWWKGFIASIIGFVIGGGMIYITGLIGDFVFKKESMGGGDVKLMAMLGAFLGWQKIIFVFLVAPVLALPMGLFFKFAKHSNVIPYGPFLSLAGLIAYFWGQPIIDWYLLGIGF